jgi:hypothetical protein
MAEDIKGSIDLKKGASYSPNSILSHNKGGKHHIYLTNGEEIEAKYFINAAG